jgi:hypothetical protein
MCDPSALRHLRIHAPRTTAGRPSAARALAAALTLTTMNASVALVPWIGAALMAAVAGSTAFASSAVPADAPPAAPPAAPAVTTPAEPDSAIAPAAEPSASTTATERLYQQLFETQMRIARAHRQAARDSLLAARARLLGQIRELRRARGDGEADSATSRRELERLAHDLQRGGENVDWEELSRQLNQSLGGLQKGLDQLGERLGDLDVEVGPERIRLGDRRTGDRVVIAIPQELRQSIKEGFQAVQQELNAALADSAAVHRDHAVHPPAPRGPVFRGFPRLGDLLKGLPEPKRKVITGPVVKVHDGFTVAANEIVQGDVVVVGGDLHVEGEILGNAVVVFGDLVLEDGASIGKDAIHVGGAMITSGQPAIHGAIYDIGHRWPALGLAGLGGGASPRWAFAAYAVRIVLVVLLLFLGAGLMGDRMTVMAERLRQSALAAVLKGALWFLIGLLAFAVATVALAITVIGIPIVVVLALGYAALLLTAYFVTCQVLGTRLLRVARGGPAPAPLRAALTGLALAEIPGLLAVALSAAPALAGTAALLQLVDAALKLLLICIGFGAVLATRAGARRLLRPLASVAASSPEPAASAG